MVEAPRTKTYIIPGEPVSWARAGLSGSHFWDTQKKIKSIYSIYLQNQHHEEPFFQGPCRADFYFYFTIPRSHSQKKRNELLGRYHFIKPDSDNLIKFFCDTAIQLLYKDDCIISAGSWVKLYDENPRTEIVITQLGLYHVSEEKKRD